MGTQRLTNDDLQKRVFINSLKTCDYISDYQNQNSIIKIKCRKHNYEFEIKWDSIRRCNGTNQHLFCPFCIQEEKERKIKENRVELECDYCHKKFLRLKSHLNKSKSGFYFCSSECRSKAAKVSSGEKFISMRPKFYGTGTSDYRKAAFENYEHKCSICGYNEEISILQVHHIDENRQNNDLNNLIILCPNCHAKITVGKYKLLNRTILIKLE